MLRYFYEAWKVEIHFAGALAFNGHPLLFMSINKQFHVRPVQLIIIHWPKMRIIYHFKGWKVNRIPYMYRWYDDYYIDINYRYGAQIMFYDCPCRPFRDITFNMPSWRYGIYCLLGKPIIIAAFLNLINVKEASQKVFLKKYFIHSFQKAFSKNSSWKQPILLLYHTSLIMDKYKFFSMWLNVEMPSISAWLHCYQKVTLQVLQVIIVGFSIGNWHLV